MTLIPEAVPVAVDLSVVVPVYKEEANIRPFLERTEKVLGGMGLSYEIIFSLDPSPDRTEEVILEEARRNPNVKLMVFSRRFGQPAATMAGILECRGRLCCVIDVDLQDPPELIPELVAKLDEGYDVAYAQRRTWPKRAISYFGYAVISRASEVKIPVNTGDFRVMTRRVVEELRSLRECHGFLRGLVAYVGFPQAAVLYDRDPRLSGKGNYNPFTGSFKIGLNGLISFSSRPLQYMSICGFILAGFSFLLGLFYVGQRAFGVDLTPGLSTTVLFISFFSGVQLLGLGLIGEYVARIYDEVKQRPLYILRDKVNF